MGPEKSQASCPCPNSTNEAPAKKRRPRNRQANFARASFSPDSSARCSPAIANRSFDSSGMPYSVMRAAFCDLDDEWAWQQYGIWSHYLEKDD